MISVLVPWKPGCQHRERALQWVSDRWAARFPEYEFIVGECAGSWSKAEAVSDALRRSHGDVLIIADADVWCESSAITAAVDALPAHGWAVPHRDVWRWNEQATEQILAGEMPDPSDVTQRPYLGWLGGGITVITRLLYESVPLDPRFVGWGQEDEAWSAALRCLAGHPWRGESDLWHLFHPPQERLSRKWGSVESKALGRRYEAAQQSPQKMRRILEEAR